jgi:hypothetical protein
METRGRGFNLRLVSTVGSPATVLVRRIHSQSDHLTDLDDREVDQGAPGDVDRQRVFDADVRQGGQLPSVDPRSVGGTQIAEPHVAPEDLDLEVLSGYALAVVLDDQIARRVRTDDHLLAGLQPPARPTRAYASKFAELHASCRKTP